MYLILYGKLEIISELILSIDVIIGNPIIISSGLLVDCC